MDYGNYRLTTHIASCTARAASAIDATFDRNEPAIGGGLDKYYSGIDAAVPLRTP